jgi:hypothetical protein
MEKSQEDQGAGKSSMALWPSWDNDFRAGHFF